MTMLQFSAMLYTATARITSRSSWHVTAFVASKYNSAATSESSAVSLKDDNTKLSEIQNDTLQNEAKEKKQESNKTQTKFQLSRKNFLNDSDTLFFKQLRAAKSINDLLNLATLPNLSTNNALKLMSNITNQINSGKSQIVNVEADERFTHLRKIVIDDKMKNNKKSSSSDLSQYSQLSTPAMITVIASLREKRNRDLPLLRMLSYNIIKYNLTLDIKQCASLLYSIAVLNLIDEDLLEKIKSDLLVCIPRNVNAVTNRSIIASLGFLRYKNEDLLDAFCDTLFSESVQYQFQSYISIIQSFAALQHKSDKANLFFEKFIEKMDLSKISLLECVDIVWCLAMLDIVKPCHVKYVLDPIFIEKIEISPKLTVSKKLKLININAVAQFILKDYEGPFLNKDLEIFKDLLMKGAKEKQVYIDALSETLQKLLPSQPYFKVNLDTNMGFLLDTECRVNDEHKFVNVENWNEQSNLRRIAIMIHTYHDYCRGQTDLVGSTYLYTQLLKAKGYHLITISYENFSIQDNIDKRVQYLKKCMDNIMNSKMYK